MSVPLWSKNLPVKHFQKTPTRSGGALLGGIGGALLRGIGGALSVAKRFFAFGRTVILGSWFGGLRARWVRESYTEIARRVYRNPYGYRAVEIVSNAVASIPYLLIRRLPGGEQETVESHPALKLLERPNPDLTGERMKKIGVINLYLAGEVILRKYGPATGPNRGAPRELRMIRPDFLQEVHREDPEDPMRITGYRFSENYFAGGEVVPAEEIIFIKTYNPLDPDRGYPIALSVLRELQLMDEITDWNKSIAQVRGRIPGFFKFEAGGKLKRTPDGMKEEKERAQQQYLEDSKDSLPGFLPPGVDFVQNQAGIMEMDFAEGDKTIARKIAIGMGLDPSILGDSANKTYSNFETAFKALFILTALPLCDFFTAELTLKLIRLFPDSENLWLIGNRRKVEAVQEDKTNVINRLIAGAGRPILDVVEARREIGLPDDPPVGLVVSAGTMGAEGLDLEGIEIEE